MRFFCKRKYAIFCLLIATFLLSACSGSTVKTPKKHVITVPEGYETSKDDEGADAYQNGYYIFPLGRFFGMWYEGTCAQKSQPLNQPFITAKPN